MKNNTKGIPKILYFNDSTNSPLNKHTIDLVNPHPIQGTSKIK